MNAAAKPQRASLPPIERSWGRPIQKDKDGNVVDPFPPAKPHECDRCGLASTDAGPTCEGCLARANLATLDSLSFEEAKNLTKSLPKRRTPPKRRGK